MKLFVYGTLMRGERYHALLEDAELLGPARTAPRYHLVDLGEYPALIEGGATCVAGELYRIQRALLDALDHLEGHPDLYCRGEIELDDGERVIGYLLPHARAAGARAILSGNWRTRELEPPR